MALLRTILSIGVTVLVLFGGWQLLVTATGVAPYILPGPARVLQTWWRQLDLIAGHAATTALEIVLGLVIGTLLGVPMGIVAAARQGTWIDSTIRVVSLIGYSVPVFWKGLMLLLLFYAVLGWTAGPGRIAVYYDGIVDVRTGLLLVDSLLAGEIEIFWNAVDHMILPAVSLGYAASAYITRMTRSFMLDQLNQEYITTARVKGLAEWRVVLFHAFRNTLVQLVTVIALTYGILLEGSVLTETVFAWPGLGQYLTKALFNGDMNAVIGATIVIGAVFVTLNLTSDILYRMLDPRAQ